MSNRILELREEANAKARQLLPNIGNNVDYALSILNEDVPDDDKRVRASGLVFKLAEEVQELADSLHSLGQEVRKNG